MSNLDFDTLRAANRTRLPLFRNARGELAHADADGSDWSLCDWTTAATGELGEAADLVKKLRRGDFSLDDLVYDKGTKTQITAREMLAKEIADVACYLDLLANRAGIDLGQAIVQKFNEVSGRVDAPVYITGTESGYGVVVDPSLKEHA